MTPAPVPVLAAAARLVAAIGTDSFEEGLIDAAHAVAQGDAAMSLMFRQGAPPQVLVDRLDPAERPFLYGDYLAGVYLVSPFFRAAAGLTRPVLRRMRDIAPPGFRQSQYYRKYYARIAVADLIGLLLPAAGGHVRFLSLSRGEGRPLFSAAGRRALESLLPLLQTAADTHDRLSRPSDPSVSANGETPRGILAASAEKPLTEREAEVVEALLAGHSEKSAARSLAISAETVKVHRRHAYRKLGVATKAELFSLFVALVRQSNP